MNRHFECKTLSTSVALVTSPVRSGGAVFGRSRAAAIKQNIIFKATTELSAIGIEIYSECLFAFGDDLRPEMHSLRVINDGRWAAINFDNLL